MASGDRRHLVRQGSGRSKHATSQERPNVRPYSVNIPTSVKSFG